MPKNLLHPFTAKFIKDPFVIFALLNKPEQNVVQIQNLSKNIKYWPKPEDLYKSDPNILLDPPKTLTDVLEANFVMRFKKLAENNVILGTYKIMKENYGYNGLESMQMRPDMVSYWINNKTYQFKGFLGIDEKHKITSATNEGRLQAINSINSQDYIELLINFEQKLEKKGKLTDEMRFILTELKEASSDKNFDSLLNIWSNNLHIFPDKWKPPLMIEKTFDSSYLNPDSLEKIRNGEIIITKISDLLYTYNVSEETGEFPDQALDYFEDSFIKKLFEN